MENVNLRPKNILVVGGGSGIGLEIAKKLLENGARNVIIASRSTEKLNSAAKNIPTKRKQNVYTLALDITKVKENRKVITQH